MGGLWSIRRKRGRRETSIARSMSGGGEIWRRRPRIAIDGRVGPRRRTHGPPRKRWRCRGCLGRRRRPTVFRTTQSGSRKRRVHRLRCCCRRRTRTPGRQRRSITRIVRCHPAGPKVSRPKIGIRIFDAYAGEFPWVSACDTELRIR